MCSLWVWLLVWDRGSLVLNLLLASEHDCLIFLVRQGCLSRSMALLFLVYFLNSLAQHILHILVSWVTTCIALLSHASGSFTLRLLRLWPVVSCSFPWALGELVEHSPLHRNLLVRLERYLGAVGRHKLLLAHGETSCFGFWLWRVLIKKGLVLWQHNLLKCDCFLVNDRTAPDAPTPVRGVLLEPKLIT